MFDKSDGLSLGGSYPAVYLGSQNHRSYWCTNKSGRTLEYCLIRSETRLEEKSKILGSLSNTDGLVVEFINHLVVIDKSNPEASDPSLPRGVTR